MTKEEEAILAVKIKNGDTKAKSSLINANLRFVVSVAKRFEGQGLPLDELIQYGNIGIVRAAERFDEKRNVKFIWFAVWHITQSILIGLAYNNKNMRIPLHMYNNMIKINKITKDVKNTMAKKEIAEKVGVSEKQVNDIFNAQCQFLSIEQPFFEYYKYGLSNILCDESTPESIYDKKEKIEIILDAINKLPEREKYIISNLYCAGIGNSNLQQIGNTMGISRERVRQIYARIKKILRRQLECLNN